MKLTFRQAHESIRQFTPVDLPDFSIITGLNGSGKTHLMRSIKAGKVIADTIPIHEIGYYTYHDFLVPSSQTLNSQQIETQKQQTWQHFNGTQGNPKVNWRNNLTNLHNQYFITTANGRNIDRLQSLPRNISIWDVYRDSSLANAQLSAAIRNYVNAVKSQVFANANFKKIPYHLSLIKALRKTDRNLHLVNEQDFHERFVPSIQTPNHLASSLGVIFTKYKVNQFLWAHRQWDKGTTSTSKSELYSEYEKTHKKPWDVVNQILADIHHFADDSLVFNFAITQPDDQRLNMESWQSYSFAPNLIDNNDGTHRQFNLLSSGEQVLLALAISIYEARDDFSFPELLLLDEIDGSLHPSMTKALIETIKNTFVQRGTKVILATHSPSTVALAPEQSIFVVHKGSVPNKIEQRETKDALAILTEGFATLSQIEPNLSIEYNLNKTQSPVLFTEGITDKIILEEAWLKLYPEKNMPFYIQDCFDAAFLANMFRRGTDDQDGIFIKYRNQILIALFDFDREGYNSWNSLVKLSDIADSNPRNGMLRSSPEFQAYALLLPVPNNQKLEKQVISSGTDTYKDQSSLSIELLFYGMPTLSKYYAIENVQGGGEIVAFKGKKRAFAENVKTLNKSSFDNFVQLFEQIENVLGSTVGNSP